MADDASTQQGTDSGKGADGGDTRAQDGKQGDGGKGQGGNDAHLDSLLGGKGTDQKGTGQQDKGNDGGKGDQGKGDDSDGFSAIEKRLMDALDAKVNALGDRVADRLVNAQGKQLRKQQGGQDDQRGDDKGQQRQDRGDAGDDGPSRADQREADLELRSELRELRPDGAGSEYRNLAEGIGRRYLADNLADGQRPERAARNAAKAATADLESFRKAVQTETVGYLRRKGQIVEGAGQGQGGGSAAAGATGQPFGREEQALKTNRAMADEFNRANGHKAPATT